MFFTKQKTRMPTQAEALPGRDTPMPVPERHAVNGTPLRPPFPEGLETSLFALGCFWGAEKDFWQTPGSTPPRSATPAASPPTRPTRRSARG
jgi:peptide-methionine (S)-S-oxide reductase